MHSLEFPTKSMEIKGEYFSIHPFYLILIIVPSMDESQQINKHKINNLHERVLRLIYFDNSSNF